ncbi:hypothetical protein DD236_01475 [Ancrocorticia populi]|uniref:Centromere-binding protein ParB C-terminal domain-containing protein n=2 Tax=Ancrocorticia populi TaxID=2175228 RepID=A0A2V1KDS8_9ACTO|nr:hypothetical protein DD236_01475 [Ancrocorticia populi]
MKSQPKPKRPSNLDVGTMSTPALKKADVNDPIVAGSASTARPASNAGNQKKFTIRLDQELLGRIRAAYLADAANGSGLNTLSKWAAHQLEKAVEESEQRTNDGQPRPPLDPGIIPTGPLG